jgi:hypothetical protein
VRSLVALAVDRHAEKDLLHGPKRST